MSSESPHTVIVVPCLGDDKQVAQFMLEKAINNWHHDGLHTIIHSVHWRDGEPFEEKLQKLLTLIDTQQDKDKISLVGISAGASLAFNAFNQRKERVHKAVNVAGRLRAGQATIRSLERMAKTSPAFRESVLSFEEAEPLLSDQDRLRLMTVRPFLGDELVPRDTADLPGAHNQWIYTPEHGLSIWLALRLQKKIRTFLTT